MVAKKVSKAKPKSSPKKAATKKPAAKKPAAKKNAAKAPAPKRRPPKPVPVVEYIEPVVAPPADVEPEPMIDAEPGPEVVAEPGPIASAPPRTPPQIWPAESITVDPETIAQAYQRVRPELENDPLFIENADDFGVSLDELDDRMQRAPAYPTSGDQLYEWLDGADQYRYAGLHVLLRALGRGSSVTLSGDVQVPDTEVRIARGDVTIDGNLELGTQAMVLVLGKLTVTGKILGGYHDYSLIAAREIECGGGLTGGEVIATEKIVSHGPFYFSGNDYSSRAPVYEGDLLVDFERGNAFTKVHVKQRISEWDFEKAAEALGVPGSVDLGPAFRAKLVAESASA